MSRQSHQRSVRTAKRKRAGARHHSAARQAAPYLVVAAVAAVAFAALLVLSVGGGSGSDVAASYPAGYSPPVLGQAAAPVELVMWGDFQCPFCRRFELSTLPAITEKYIQTGKVRFVWRNFDHYGEESRDAANGAYCAGEQGKFWEYHALLYQNQGGINTGAFSRMNLNRFAGELALDTSRFSACFDAFKYDSVLASDYRAGREAGVNGTPAFFVNGQYVAGAQPLETFESLIEQALADAS